MTSTHTVRLGLLALTVLASPAASETAVSTDWPTFRGPNGDGKSAETGLPDSFPETGLPVVWEVETAEGYSAPSIAGGRLFLFDRPGDTARLRCLESGTGKQLWKAEYSTDYEDYYGYSNGPRATPVVDGNRVYTFGVEGRLRAHAIEDGRLLWDVDTATAFGVVKNFFGTGSTPVVDGDLLWVPVGGSPPGAPKVHSGEVRGNGSGLVAFDAATGAVKHRFSDELASYATPVLAEIGGERWGFHFARGGLVAFDPGSAKERFHFPWRAKILESVNAASPVVVDDLVFISETYGPGSALLRIKPDGPEVVWKDPPGQRNHALSLHWNTPILHDDHLYASSGRNTGDAELRAVVLDTGEVKWKQPGLSRSTLLMVDDRLLVFTEYGRLLLVEPHPEAYRELADLTPRDKEGKTLLQYPAWSPPALSNGLLYLKGKGKLIATRLIPPR